MTDNKIDLIAIKDLVGMNFFIPSYQRGYRWKEIEINALLDDINEFNTERDGKFYCLQPLVVRKKDNRYRIIDGQQRLTTILLTLKALNDNDLKTEIIEYERDNYFSQLPFDYINEIQITANNKTQANSKYIEYIDDGNQDKDKIEFYYLFTNYLHIRKWLQENSHEQLADKIKNDTCFIWYNIEIINDDDEYDIFRNLNSGKIPLTNAELIKALFLRNIKNADYNNNKTNENERERELTQKIIAEEYDQIERRIRDLEFWYFLNPNKQQASSCINFIFDLMYQTDEKLSDDKRKEIESVGSNSTFYYFERKISYNSEGTRRNIEEQFNMSKSIWEDVQKYFHTLEGWFEDSEIFNLIGFLTASSVRIKDVYTIFKNSNNKNNFRDNVKQKCYEICGLFKEDLASSGNDNEEKQLSKLISKDEIVRNFRYDVDKKTVEKILLLINIATLNRMLSKDKAKSEKDQKDKISTISKFSFASFHQCNWHVEHISPNNAQYKDDNSGSKAFLDDIIPSGVVFDEKEKFKESNKLTEEQKSQFDKFIAITDNSIMSLKNLTLLTEHINTSIGNDFFHDKRTAVLNKQSEGFFVPPSTFMIFTKGYTEKIAPDELNFWHENDRNMYMDKIYGILSKYYTEK